MFEQKELFLHFNHATFQCIYTHNLSHDFLITSLRSDFSDLLLASQHLVPQSLVEASATDFTDAFPGKTLEAIKESKLLSA